MSGESDHLADNIKAMRESRGLSQQQMAKIAGVPRATWTHLESGAANPTLAVLIKAANALQVRLDELLAAPHQTARFVKASELTTRNRGNVAIRKLLPEPLPGLDMERMVLPAGARMAGVPHTPGTREYTLAEGDVLSFRGDQRHSYHNPGNSTAVAYSAIAFAPTSG
jgi:transcriptional regulator with XRE-family HTH domain